MCRYVWFLLHDSLCISHQTLSLCLNQEGRDRREYSKHGEQKYLQVSVRENWKKRNPDRPWPRCEDNIDTHQEEIGWEGVEWLVQDRDKSVAVLNKAMNLRILKIWDIS